MFIGYLLVSLGLYIFPRESNGEVTLPNFATVNLCPASSDDCFAGRGRAILSTSIGCYSKKSGNGKKKGKVIKSGLETGNCGEDAFYIHEKDDFIAFGVADGVGGWNEQGIDPSFFSRALTSNALKVVSSNNGKTPNPLEVMTRAFHLTATVDPKDHPGSSTACFLTIDKVKGYLYTANLGDSGFMIIRNGTLMFKSKEQQNRFNFPYQLTIYPGSLDSKSGNQPSQSETRKFKLQKGDVIVTASDGLFDNVFQDDIGVRVGRLQDRFSTTMGGAGGDNDESSGIDKQATVNLKTLKAATDVVVKELLEMAVELGRDQSYFSPFAEHAQEHGLDYIGGKADDVTIILSFIL